MQFLLLIHIDPELIQALPAEEYDAEMRGCLAHADELQAQGILVMSQQLQPVQQGKIQHLPHQQRSHLMHCMAAFH